MGSYFGSSLCAVDLNQDGLSDLLVGAPMHSQLRDEGQVSVYLSKGNVSGMCGSAGDASPRLVELFLLDARVGRAPPLNVSSVFSAPLISSARVRSFFPPKLCSCLVSYRLYLLC